MKYLSVKEISATHLIIIKRGWAETHCEVVYCMGDILRQVEVHPTPPIINVLPVNKHNCQISIIYVNPFAGIGYLYHIVHWIK